MSAPSRAYKIISVVGARPNFMKVAPLHKAFKQYPSVQHRIVHTGQHYDANMSKVFFEDLELPRPDVYLGIGSGSQAEQTAKVMIEFEKVVLGEKPDLVVVVGDVNSTVACTLVCAKLLIPVAHVEAGLRSFDRTMPEEINRLLTDAIADFLFVSERSGLDNLKREGVADSKVYFVGNIMIDSLVHYRETSRRSVIKKTLGVEGKKYVLVTLHRPSNVDVRTNLSNILSMLESIARAQPVIFPVHPRTRKMIDEFDLRKTFAKNSNIILCDPLGYLDFLCLLESAALAITDSGGIQEETTYLGVPCLTMRENTERPSTVSEGTNTLMGFDYEKTATEAGAVFRGTVKKGKIPELWDGKTAERIAKIMADELLSINRRKS
ncbi:MAG TPA: UDP-N-acetylglucosamine 2-epimerase (non-hydrolyzing) [Bacteroidota bacterium]|nr:UDP-N-acetylglucosamine 2-epimerase (non-hydrolyzing) [Bacteroidota bacterium]